MPQIKYPSLSISVWGCHRYLCGGLGGFTNINIPWISIPEFEQVEPYSVFTAPLMTICMTFFPLLGGSLSVFPLSIPYELVLRLQRYFSSRSEPIFLLTSKTQTSQTNPMVFPNLWQSQTFKNLRLEKSLDNPIPDNLL